MIISRLLKSFNNSIRYFSSQAKINEANNLYGINSKQSLDAHFDYATNLISKNNIDDSKSIFLKAINISKEIHGFQTQITSNLIKRIAELFFEIGDIENSLHFYIQAYKIDLEILSKEDESLSESATIIGSLYINLKQFIDAKNYLMSVLQGIENSNNNELKGVFYHNLGHTTKELNQIENALKYLELAKSYLEKIHSQKELIKSTYHLLASCYWTKNQYLNAKYYFITLLDLLRIDFEENISNIISIYTELGYLSKASCLEKEMHQYFEKAYELSLNNNIEDKNEQIARLFLNISNELSKFKDPKNSLIYLERLLKHSKEHFGEESKWTADTYHKMSVSYFDQMKIVDSLNYSSKSLAIRRKFENNYNDLIESCLHHGLIYKFMGHLDSSLNYYLKVSEILKKSPEKTYETEYNLKLSNLYISKNNYILAEDHMIKHIEGFKELNGENHIKLIEKYNELGNIYKIWKKYDKALEVYDRVLNLNERINGRESKNTADILENIGEIYRLKRNFEKALNNINESYKLKVQLFKNFDLSLHTSYFYLAEIYTDMNDSNFSIYMACGESIKPYTW